MEDTYVYLRAQALTCVMSSSVSYIFLAGSAQTLQQAIVNILVLEVPSVPKRVTEAQAL